MKQFLCSFGLAISLGMLLPTAIAAEPPVSANELPRTRPIEPNDSVQSFQLRPGLRTQLIASEPVVVDPIALSFDENGRLFVVEMRDYSERRDERLGRIRLLTDEDGDGRFDHSTVYADNLPWPTAVICWNGGVFVGATPDIVYCKDTNGDGVADVREVVYTGFASGQPRLNVQQLFNSFAWGLDNRIHGAGTASSGVITSPKSTMAPLNLRGRDFSFDPRTYDFRAESGGGQYGLSFDSAGRKFVCSNSAHILAVMYEDRYTSLNPFYVLPPPVDSIPVDGGPAEVYRISPEEPWRILRTRWRVSGLVPGPIEGGGRSAGYFTGATGITIYRGNALSREFLDNAFIGDAGGNLVHRKKISRQGVAQKAERPADEQKVEFLASRDTWFRPVQMANAPDGSLCIIDIYREVIEHPWSLPQNIKQHLDLNSGNDRGRIYRVVPDGFRQPARPRLGGAGLEEVVAILDGGHGWQRDTAARLLYERQDPAAAPLLRTSMSRSTNAVGRMHSLYVLKGLGLLTEADVLKGLSDSHSLVRRHAVRLSEELPKTGATPELLAQVSNLAGDPDAEVRFQVAFTSGYTRHPSNRAILTSVLRRDAADPWIRAAVLAAAREDAAAIFQDLWPEAPFVSSPGGLETLTALAKSLGARARPEDLDRILPLLARTTKPSRSLPVLNVLGDELRRNGSSLFSHDSARDLAQWVLAAKDLATRGEDGSGERIEAIRFLGQTDYATAGPDLTQLLKTPATERVQTAAINSLAGFRGLDGVTAVLKSWNMLGPRVRSSVIATLLQQAERVSLLLAALEETIQPSELSIQQRDGLRQSRDSAVRARAEFIFGVKPLLARVAEEFASALELPGSAAAGARIYQERCVSCHRTGKEGFALGPDLVTMKTMGKETLLANIIDPNREVAPRYLSFTAETRDGEEWTGIIVTETDNSITLAQPNGQQTQLFRSNLSQLRSQGVSAMPEGLASGLTPQNMADLLAFIQSAQPPSP